MVSGPASEACIHSAGRKRCRAGLLLATAASALLAPAALLRGPARALGFSLWKSAAPAEVTQNNGPGQPMNLGQRGMGRRSLLPGFFQLPLLAAPVHASQTPGAEEETLRALQAQWAKEDEEACRCCSTDWCGCDNCSNCYTSLKAGGYELPLDAKSAYAKAGLDWASVLNWEAVFPKMPGVALMATADRFQVGKSGIKGAGDGLFVKQALPRGSVLPPYQGRVLNFAEGTKGGPYVWCPISAGLRMYLEEDEATAGSLSQEPSYCIDSLKAKTKNPARFVNGAGTREECKAVNLEICEIGDVMYFRTTQDVKAGVELVTDYGDFYWANNEAC